MLFHTTGPVNVSRTRPPVVVIGNDADFTVTLVRRLVPWTWWIVRRYGVFSSLFDPEKEK